jgi:hypothetical protein
LGYFCVNRPTWQAACSKQGYLQFCFLSSLPRSSGEARVHKKFSCQMHVFVWIQTFSVLKGRYIIDLKPVGFTRNQTNKNTNKKETKIHELQQGSTGLTSMIRCPKAHPSSAKWTTKTAKTLKQKAGFHQGSGQTIHAWHGCQHGSARSLTGLGFSNRYPVCGSHILPFCLSLSRLPRAQGDSRFISFRHQASPLLKK